MKLEAALVLALCLLAGAAGAQPLGPGDHTRTLVAGGVTRSYLVHVPPGYTGQAAVPLVVDIHGLSATAAIQKNLSGFDQLADAVGFIVAYPEGLDNAFNGGICCSTGVDDVGFIRGLVAKMRLEAEIDARRVYATGLSNGGAMTHRLACEAADLFAAAAPLAFPISIDPPSACQPSRPIPVLTFMGLTDVLVPYGGGSFPSAQTTIDHWRATNGCGTGAYEQHFESGLSYCDIDTSCADGVQAGLCSITADSFGGQPFDGHILYLNPDYDLAQVAWDFLSQFESPPPALPALAPALLAPLAGLLGALGIAGLRRLAGRGGPPAAADPRAPR